MVALTSPTVLILFTLSLSVLGTQAFSLYPTVDPDALAKALNISSDCLGALNETVSCDDDLFQWTVTVDDHWWEPENLTQLCTSDCTASATSWVSDVLSTCVNDDLVIQGRRVPAATVADRFLEGLGVACLQSSGSWCMIESQSWQGSDIVRPDCTTDPSDPSCTSGDPSNVTSDDARLSQLYSDEMLCSGCFVELFNLRLTSNYLPDDDYSDYLVGQFQDIQDVCNTTVGAISTRFFAGYNSATVVSNITTATTSVSVTTTTSSTTSTTTSPIVTPTPTQNSMVKNCNKFVLSVAGVSTCFDIANNNSITLEDFYEWNPDVGTNCTGLWAGYYFCVGVEPAPGSSSSSACQTADLTLGLSKDPTANCENLSLTYNVTTGDLLKVATDESCYLNGTACVPPPCQLVQIPDNSTCDSLAASFAAASSLNVTKQMVLSWNPNILGPCDNLTAAQYVCAGAPGGSYAPPALAPPDVGAGGQERGGPGGSDPTAVTGTPTVIVTSGADSNPTAAPLPTQAGSIADGCDQYDQAEKGDTCASFAARNGVAPASLYAWNAVLGPAGTDCATQFWAGYYYCIGTVAGGGSSTTTTATTTTTTPVAAPGPTQSGIPASCKSFAEAASGDTCSGFASANGITTAQLYAWNPVLGANGENCATSFWANEWYCVGVTTGSKVRRDSVENERPWVKYRRGLE